MKLANKEQMLALLTAQSCPYKLHEHPAVFSVEEATEHCAHIPGAHVKNLFLRNKKKTAYWLLTVKDEKRVDLLALGEQWQAGRLSFASPADLISMLGIQPGSVTPLAILNDEGKQIKLFFDEELLKEKVINVHPLENTATLSLALTDLRQLIEQARQEKLEFIAVPEMKNGA